MPVTIELTAREVKTLKFYLNKAIIDAEGMSAIGVGSKESVSNLKSVMTKIGNKYD